MRTKIFHLLFIFIIALFSFYGCKKDESNPVNNSNFSAEGSDYLPVTSGKILNVKVSGSTTVYDSLGSVISFTQISDENYNGTIGALVFIRNMNANPIFGNDKGKSNLICYISNNNGEIVGFYKNSQNFIILPSELTIGKEWIANPQSPVNEQIRVKLVETLNSFTNSAGKVFQNIINLSVTSIDSLGGTNYYNDGSSYIWYYKKLLNGNIYLSKGIGIIGIKLNAYEETEKGNYSTLGEYNYYKRTKVNGVIGIID